MSKLIRDIVTDSLSDAYVNGGIIGIDTNYHSVIKNAYQEILPYLDDKKQPIEITETECKKILSRYAEVIQTKAFIDGFSVGCKLSNLKM